MENCLRDDNMAMLMLLRFFLCFCSNLAKSSGFVDIWNTMNSYEGYLSVDSIEATVMELT
jgi:hypothetical protein